MVLKAIKIAEDIEARIKKNEWPDGRLPTARELVAEYAVSSRTVAQAIESLKSRRLIRTIPGKGTYVK